MTINTDVSSQAHTIVRLCADDDHELRAWRRRLPIDLRRRAFAGMDNNAASESDASPRLEHMDSSSTIPTDEVLCVGSRHVCESDRPDPRRAFCLVSATGARAARLRSAAAASPTRGAPRRSGVTPPTCKTAGRELRGRVALGLPARCARCARRASSRPLVVGARVPRRRAGGAKERRARGATDGTREEDQAVRESSSENNKPLWPLLHGAATSL